MGTTGGRTFDCHWECMNCRVGTNNLVFCRGNNMPTLFSKCTKEIFIVHGACHSPNTFPTRICDNPKGFPFYNVTIHHPESIPYPPHGEAWAALVVEPGRRH